MDERIETTILRSLAHNEEFSRKVLPFIRSEYFTEYAKHNVDNVTRLFCAFLMNINNMR